MTQYALRMALVLPLMLLALGGVLVAARRGLIRLPGTSVGPAALVVIQVASLGPGSKLAVADFAGRRLLIAVGKTGVVLLDRGEVA